MLRSAPVAAALLAALTPVAPALAQESGFRSYATAEIRGAEFIPEADIRQTCGELEGVALDAVDLAAIEDCLMYTGVFEEVTLTPQGDVLLVEVREVPLRPGRIDAGLAWSNDYGLSGTLNYEQLNLIPGTWLAVRNTWSEDYKAYQFSLYAQKPSLAGLKFALDIGGTRERYGDLDFSARSDIAELWALWEADPALSFEGGIGYRDQRLYDVQPGASPLLRQEAGAVKAPFLRFAFDYATPAAPEGAEEGARRPRASLRVESYLWNLGTGRRLSELRIETAYLQPLGSDYRVTAALRGGLVRGLGGALPNAQDRGFAGGETLRGFAPRGLGPIHQGSRLGGERWLSATLEMQRRLPVDLAKGLTAGVFLDAGTAWRLSDSLGGVIDDTARLRTSLGLSLSFDVSNVPVSLYIATPLKRVTGDRRQVFGLSAAARF
ncbi:BamA/TamA family outer membrane protein [Falsigemmobacter faecalis]|uniref:Bacterial surface antigen (D15) domain-containing protein n=1 Tax=Falsigemmobacter faecalis TaxID=2488730 RepID=A0A3P3DPJ5_9RHOB|nr:BamA/TamA family outer membrane protein [Falsigemmobacter faecalis]RRH76150.1 hypothetical protein EG244_06945 [Falsigemmobacter faecalis]